MFVRMGFCLLTVVSLVVLLVPGLTMAQEIPRDTTREFGRAVTYDQLVREYLALRRIPEITAPAPADSAQDGVIRLEVDAMVVDETQTKVGRDFYDVFFNAWKSPRNAFNYTVRIQEQPVPGLGTRILVRVNDEVAYQAQLQPRYELIEASAQQAIGYVQYVLLSRANGGISY